MRENPSQFAVIGLGRFGSAVAKKLYQLGKEVLALDIDEENVKSIAPFVTHAAVLDAMDENALKEIGLKNFDAVVISIAQDMQASVLATLICKEMGVKLIIAKASDNNHKKVLEKIGADIVLFPEIDQGEKLAHQLVNPVVEELADITSDIKIIKTSIPPAWEGKSLQELKIRQKHGITLVLVEREGTVFSSPDGTFVLESGDEVIVLGEQDDLAKFAKKV